MNLLVVCDSNVGRSPTFEYLLKMLISKSSRADISISSAGLKQTDYKVIAPQMRAILERLGVKGAEKHTPRLLTKECVERSDLILTMNTDQKQEIIKRFGKSASGKVFTLRGFSIGKEHILRHRALEVKDVKGRPTKDRYRRTSELMRLGKRVLRRI